ncbi:MAG: M48 family metallopeptidase [Gemmatimonadales bacterium]
MPRNFLEQEAANRRRTWLIMVLFVVFLTVIGAGLDAVVFGGGYPIATATAIVIGVVSAWWTYRWGDRAILKSSSAVPLEDSIRNATSDDERLRLEQYGNIVHEVAIAAGLPAPAAWVIPDDDPNAFATGRDPAHASIAVTAGLLRTLDREELQAVVGHEMSHVRNYDIRLMMVIAALMGAVLLLAHWSSRALWFDGRGRRNNRNGGAGMVVLLVVWIVAIVLAPIAARLLSLMVSRTREYLADASGAELTRNPLALASALRKIDAAAQPTEHINQGTAALCIADPAARPVNERDGFWANLWATHPPIPKRIAALEAMAGQSAA